MLGVIETARLKELKRPLCSPALLEAHHGVRLPDEKLLGAWRVWAGTRRRPVLIQSDGLYDRYAFETFLQQEELLPVKWAAARLGMERSSFEEILAELEEKGRLPETRDLGASVVDERLVRNFQTLFPALRSTLFSNHNSFCESLHEAVKDDLGLTVAPLRCKTAEALEEDDFANDFDAITDWPMGLRYQVWLETGKPMNLRPDACSVLLFSRAKEELEPLVMAGQGPQFSAKLAEQAPAPH